METLIKIIKIEAPKEGYEMHFKVQGTTEIKKEFVERPATKGGK